MRIVVSLLVGQQDKVCGRNLLLNFLQSLGKDEVFADKFRQLLRPFNQHLNQDQHRSRSKGCIQRSPNSRKFSQESTHVSRNFYANLLSQQGNFAFGFVHVEFGLLRRSTHFFASNNCFLSSLSPISAHSLESIREVRNRSLRRLEPLRSCINLSQGQVQLGRVS